MNQPQTNFGITIDYIADATVYQQLVRQHRYTSNDAAPYCSCGHAPSVVPISRKGKHGTNEKAYVAMCTPCMPGGAMSLEEHVSADLAVAEFETKYRLGNVEVHKHAI